jgi:pimeloyl-ACP methyl ester carboxylesterase
MKSFISNVTYGDHEIQFSISSNGGTGDPVICLHGIQGSREVLEPLISDKRFSDYCMLAVDFVGFGNTSKPDDFSYTLSDQAGAILALMSELGHPRFHVLGHSLGGMVGTVLISEAPERVMSFINMEGNLVFKDCGDSKKAAEMNFEEFESDYFPNLIDRQRLRGLEHLASSMERTGAYVFYQTAREIVEVSQSEALLPMIERSQLPVLFLIGTKSGYFSRPVSDTIQLKEIEDADHFSLSRNEDSFSEIERFLKEVSS